LKWPGYGLITGRLRRMKSEPTDAYSLTALTPCAVPGGTYSGKRGDDDTNVARKATAPRQSLFTLVGKIAHRGHQALARRGSHSKSRAPGPLERTFLDTFDWRLHAAGTALQMRVSEQSARLTWQPISVGNAYAVAPMESEPHFGADLLDGPIREELAPVLGPPALPPRHDCRADSA